CPSHQHRRLLSPLFPLSPPLSLLQQLLRLRLLLRVSCWSCIIASRTQLRERPLWSQPPNPSSSNLPSPQPTLTSDPVVCPPLARAIQLCRARTPPSLLRPTPALAPARP